MNCYRPIPAKSSDSEHIGSNAVNNTDITQDVSSKSKTKRVTKKKKEEEKRSQCHQKR
jgi:ribosomal protein L21